MLLLRRSGCRSLPWAGPRGRARGWGTRRDGDLGLEGGQGSPRGSGEPRPLLPFLPERSQQGHPGLCGAVRGGGTPPGSLPISRPSRGPSPLGLDTCSPGPQQPPAGECPGHGLHRSRVKCYWDRLELHGAGAKGETVPLPQGPVLGKQSLCLLGRARRTAAANPAAGLCGPGVRCASRMCLGVMRQFQMDSRAPNRGGSSDHLQSPCLPLRVPHPV